jgi:DNA (cytosine-5)-methyltransferase 1
MDNPIRLCGVMFGLEVIRHRLFESNVAMVEPLHTPHRGTVHDGTYVTVAGHGGDNIKGRGSRAAKQRAMGIDWMTDTELNEAIPPAYTEWVGLRLRAHLAERAA